MNIEEINKKIQAGFKISENNAIQTLIEIKTKVLKNFQNIDEDLAESLIVLIREGKLEIAGGKVCYNFSIPKMVGETKVSRLEFSVIPIKKLEQNDIKLLDLESPNIDIIKNLLSAHTGALSVTFDELTVKELQELSSIITLFLS